MFQDITKSIEACAEHYGESREAMKRYLTEGQAAAIALGNRGPAKFDDNGKLDASIREAYSKYGFYVFENTVSDEELQDLKAGIQEMRDNFPVSNGAKVDAQGRPALSTQCKMPNLNWAKPLTDPLGGTGLLNGRHQVKIFEPKAADSAPEFAPFILTGHLQFSDATLRAYANPTLLQIAAAINGEDFAPFHESVFFKDPGLGAAVSWHQDGDTHWDSPDFDEDIHGFNFMLQVHGSTAVNGVWVIPGTHKQGRIDIKELVSKNGSERLPGAVPLVCNPGDVVMCNRQLVHGSFANTGFETRVTVNFGFHRRASVLDVMGAGMHSAAAVYTAEFIHNRSRLLGYAIDARKQKYPNETPFNYAPLAGETYVFDENTRANITDYNLQDLSI
ncbi:MAG: phytanoyl-CoA dioxygenase [Alteromonadaceae bacterium]|nr:phytanoyl-CoA dioxygenase [Alteromonadaceae bacterium]